MHYNLFLILFFFLTSSTSSDAITPKENNFSNKKLSNTINSNSNLQLMTEMVYKSLDAHTFLLPNFECFAEAFEGYHTLKENGLVKKEILTLIDFSLSANSKRLWVIDLTNNKIVFHSLVAHGRNTGDEFANQFSNQDSSFKSSLGFYSTGEIYKGKHGWSLKLDGLEKGVNSNARNRAIVVHAADYVSEKFIKENKRLGRSLGCPALPNELNFPIITTIKEQSILFIYHPSRKKEEKSDLFRA